MPQTTLTVRMDANLKKQFDALCAEFGMTASTAVTIFAKTIVRERKIPFEITASDPFYSEANQQRLTKSIEQLNANAGTRHDLLEVGDA